MIEITGRPPTIDDILGDIAAEATDRSYDFGQWCFAARRSFAAGSHPDGVPTPQSPVEFAGQSRPFDEWERWRGPERRHLMLVHLVKKYGFWREYVAEQERLRRGGL